MLPTERSRMGAGRDRPHDPAAGFGRQPRIQRRADQLVAEQRHLLRPLPAPDVVLLGCARHENLNSARESPASTGRGVDPREVFGYPPVAAEATRVATSPAGRAGQSGASSRPAEHAAATCQAVTGPSTPTGPNRLVTATIAAPNAASTLRHGEPSAAGTGRSTPAREATCNRCNRTGSSRSVSTRSQPRTVVSGTLSARPIDRWP